MKFFISSDSSVFSLKSRVYLHKEQQSPIEASAEQLDTLVKESLNIVSENIQEDQVRKFLKSPACNTESFNNFIQKKEWSPGWNKALATSLGKESLETGSIQKIQKALGTLPDGKFGPHSLARLLKLKNTLTDQSSDFSMSYIDRWDQKSKETVVPFETTLKSEDSLFLQSLFANESEFYGAKILTPETIKVLDNRYIAIAQKGDLFFRISVDKNTQPPTVSWEEVLEGSFYDKTFGSAIEGTTKKSAEKIEKPLLYTVKNGDALIRILRNQFGKTQGDMRSMTVDYRDPKGKGQGTTVLDTGLIYPGQKIWIEGDTVIVSREDERKPMPAKTPEVSGETVQVITNYLFPSATTKDLPTTSAKDLSITPIEPSTPDPLPDSVTPVESQVSKEILKKKDVIISSDNQLFEEPLPTPTKSPDVSAPLDNAPETPKNWSDYEEFIQKYYFEHAISKDPSFLKEVWYLIRGIFTADPPQPPKFEDASDMEQYQFKVFSMVLLKNFEFRQIQPPQKQEGVKKILDSLFKSLQNDPKLYKNGQLFFDGSFIEKNSIDTFKLSALTRVYSQSFQSPTEGKDAQRRYENTQAILRVVEEAIQNKIWEKNMVQN